MLDFLTSAASDIHWAFVPNRPTGEWDSAAKMLVAAPAYLAVALLVLFWAVNGFKLRRKPKAHVMEFLSEVNEIIFRFQNLPEGHAVQFNEKIVRCIAHADSRDGLLIHPRHPKLEAYFVPTKLLRRSVSASPDCKVSFKRDDWSEYIHDAEFMDLDLFVEKWRDREKPKRPEAVKAPVCDCVETRVFCPHYVKPALATGYVTGPAVTVTSSSSGTFWISPSANVDTSAILTNAPGEYLPASERAGRNTCESTWLEGDYYKCKTHRRLVRLKPDSPFDGARLCDFAVWSYKLP